MKNKVMKKVLMIMLSATMLIGSASVTAFAQANENAEQAETAEQVIEEQPAEQPAAEGTPFSTSGNGQLVDDKENDSSKQFPRFRLRTLPDHFHLPVTSCTRFRKYRNGQ